MMLAPSAKIVLHTTVTRRSDWRRTAAYVHEPRQTDSLLKAISMSQWTDRVETHPIHELLSSLNAAFDQAQEYASGTASATDALSRVRQIADFVRYLLATIDPILVNPTTLTNLEQQLREIHSQVRNYISNQNEGHLTNANNTADALLAISSQLNAVRTPQDVEHLKDAIVSFRRGVSQHLRYVDEEVEPLRSKINAQETRLAELSSEIVNQRNQITSLISEYQSQFSRAQEARASEHAEAMRARQEEHMRVEKERADRFQAGFEERTAAADDYLNQISERRDELEAEVAALKETHERALQRQVNAILEALHEKKGEAERLLNVIGTLGVTSGYQKAANEARRFAIGWQVITLGAMAFLIYFAYHAFLPLVVGDFTWESFAGRVFLSLTIGVLAAYAAHQADKYHRSEQRNRQLELELASLGPYLETLPEDKQQEFKLLMADRTFGRFNGLDGNVEKSPSSVTDVLMKSKDFREFVTELVRAAK